MASTRVAHRPRPWCKSPAALRPIDIATRPSGRSAPVPRGSHEASLGRWRQAMPFFHTSLAKEGISGLGALPLMSALYQSIMAPLLSAGASWQRRAAASRPFPGLAACSLECAELEHPKRQPIVSQNYQLCSDSGDTKGVTTVWRLLYTTEYLPGCPHRTRGADALLRRS